MLLAFGACTCDANAKPKRKVERPEAEKPIFEGAEEKPPEIEGTPIDPEQIAALLPASLGTATSENPAEPKSSALGNGGMLTSAKRTYTMGSAKIVLEVSDTQHAPALRMLLQRKQDQGHNSPNSSWKTVTLGDRPGFVQWNGTKHTAVATLLVGGRLLVNVQLDPADSSDAAFAVAQTVPFEAIEKLAATAGKDEPTETP